jgi:hypothetical protein
MTHTKDEALKLALEALEESETNNDTMEFWDRKTKAITAIKQALTAPVQEPVAFLANGTRFKISYDSRQSGGQIHGIPPELGGRWVAFVAAEDDCHLKLTTPPAAQAAHISPKQLLALAQEANLGLDKVIEAFRIAAQPAVPDALNPKDENPAYAAGWNDCRAAMMEMMK